MTDQAPEPDPTDNPLAAFLASLGKTDIGEIAKMLGEPKVPEIEPWEEQAKTLVSTLGDLTDKDHAMNGARLRLASMVAAETTLVTKACAHFAYHAKEAKAEDDEEAYKLLTSVAAQIYRAIVTCRGPIVAEALEIAQENDLSSAQASALLMSALSYHPDISEPEINIGVVLCENNPFTSSPIDDLPEIFKILYTHNPHEEHH